MSPLHSTLESSISFPTYSEELIEARRYNLMSHFHCFVPDETRISQLLYYSVKLAEDLRDAEIRNKRAAQDQRTAQSTANRQAARPSAGPIRWKRRR